jgi:SAM-dependent methyltransferase
MFFPDEQAALREVRRVLRHDGRLALSVWGRAEDVPLVDAALSCLRRLLPPPKVARPSIFRFGDPDGACPLPRQRRLISDRGATGQHHHRFPDAATYWQGFLDLAGGAAESLSRLPPEKMQALAAAVADDLAPHASKDGYRLTSTVLVASAGPV